MQGLDAVDVRILELIQEDATLSTADIAERVGLSQSPCWRRIQRMRDEGYIKKQVTLVDRAKLGYHMQMFAQLKMSRLNEAERLKFARALDAAPEIVECYTIFGELDVMLKILAPDVAWYQEFIWNTVMKLPGVLDVRSIVTLVELKSTTFIPPRVRKFP